MKNLSQNKEQVCAKTAGLRYGNFSDLNAACLKVLVPVKIFQFPDMQNEIERYRDATNGLWSQESNFINFFLKYTVYLNKKKLSLLFSYKNVIRSSYY